MKNYIQESLIAGGVSTSISGSALMDGCGLGNATMQITTGVDAGTYSLSLQGATIPFDSEDEPVFVTFGTFTETELKITTFRISRHVLYRVSFTAGTNASLSVRIRG